MVQWIHLFFSSLAYKENFSRKDLLLEIQKSGRQISGSMFKAVLQKLLPGLLRL
jgi:hypothetical protein